MKNNSERVLVAMSGGVDSSVAAFILKDKGYEVMGATMDIPHRDSRRHIEDAKEICNRLGITHHVLDFEEIFRREVVDYFAREYLSGRTPNPCIVCNEKIKFGSLLKKAEELGCGCIATGHYARIEKKGFRLKEGVDKAKDQSYFLFALKTAQIQKTLFPVGSLTKAEVMAISEKLGLCADKKESQEICFIPGNDYADFIKHYSNIDAKKGDIVDSSGRVLGNHSGFWNFTIGQRKGLGLSLKKPAYVVAIDPEKNEVMIGSFSEVKKKRFLVRGINWHCKNGKVSFEADVKIRYLHKKAKALLRETEDKRVEVEFREGQEAITPGQAAVFYDGEYVLGGGWIDRVLV